MRAVGYPRVSTYGQDTKGYSLENQIQSIEQFCLNQGIELVAHYTETESAATIASRPGFKAALRHVYNDPTIEAIIVTNLDRHSRSMLDFEIIQRGLSKRGKRLISIQEQYLTPLHDIDPEFSDYLEAAIKHRMVEAEQERKRIVRRFTKGKQQKIDNGGWIGFKPPYEYDAIQGELVKNPERARTVRHMHRLKKYLDWTYGQIAEYLNERQIPPPLLARVPKRKRNKPPRRGKPYWDKRSVRNILWNKQPGEDGQGIERRTWGPGSDKQGKLRKVV